MVTATAMRTSLQQLFHRFTIALDIIGFELTHGITQYEGGRSTPDRERSTRSMSLAHWSSSMYAGRR